MAKKKLNSDALNEIIKKEIKPEESVAARFVKSIEKEKTKKVMGQPKKYHEPLTYIGFKIPESAAENLKILSALAKTSQTQFILGLINGEIEKNKDKIKAYKELTN